jgi:hypothetical protein
LHLAATTVTRFRASLSIPHELLCCAGPTDDFDNYSAAPEAIVLELAIIAGTRISDVVPVSIKRGH